ncbi:MAG: hypothetical protein WEA58_13160 [Balneolaceae bacterium]
MTELFKKKIRKEVELALNDAEKVWDEVGEHIFKNAHVLFEARAGVEMPSKIPGFPYVEDGKPKVADYIALVLDIRGSTNHLTQAISDKTSKVNQLQRVLYETTAINTAGSMIVTEFDGKITEYLGDGYLALFKVESKGDKEAVYNANNTSKLCIDSSLNIINELLYDRYNLPPLKIGIGMAFSSAIVTLVGHGDNLHPKAIGECVYRASKLSNGVNEVYIDDRLKKLWPSSDGGKLRFISLNKHSDIKSYKIDRSS